MFTYFFAATDTKQMNVAQVQSMEGAINTRQTDITLEQNMEGTLDDFKMAFGKDIGECVDDNGDLQLNLRVLSDTQVAAICGVIARNAGHPKWRSGKLM